MASSSWLSLQDYSIKKGISVSTLRRKIKNSDIEYRKDNGRYFLKEEIEAPLSPSDKEVSLLEKELKLLKRDKEDLWNLVHFLETEKKNLEEHFTTLKNENEDILRLVHFLEQEKKDLQNYLEHNTAQL